MWSRRRRVYEDVRRRWGQFAVGGVVLLTVVRLWVWALWSGCGRGPGIRWLKLLARSLLVRAWSMLLTASRPAWAVRWL